MNTPATRAFRAVVALALLRAALVVVVLAWPAGLVIPVHGATAADWNHDSFWHHPWGRSVVHKGIDIFAGEGADVVASTPGVVVRSGRFGRGGNIVVVLGPSWRLHYYAHLRSIAVRCGQVVGGGERLGTVGRTGNAASTPAHLHYSIVTLVPLPWQADTTPQGWRKVFFLDPTAELLRTTVR